MNVDGIRVPTFVIALLILQSGAASLAVAQVPIVIGRFGSEATGSSEPHDFAATADLVFFAADTNATGQEVWRSDGTSAGTYLLADAPLASASLFPRAFRSIGDLVFWTDNDATLWVSDGTVAGTKVLMQFSVRPSNLVTAGGLLYFAASHREVDGRIWRSDGTSAGTLPIDDIPRQATGFPIFAAGSSIFFGIDSAETLDLWKADGSGATRVTPLPYGTDPYIARMVNAGGVAFFVVNRDFSANPLQDLWLTDGSAAGTRLLAENLHGVVHLFAAGDRLYFGADDGASGVEPWVSDGTPVGTRMLRDIGPGAASSVLNDQPLPAFDALDDLVVFTADDGSHGRELWITDGTGEGTTLLRDIAEGPGTSSPRLAGSIGQAYLFIARDDSHGTELWRTDGTTAGTTQIRDIAPGPSSSIDRPLTVVEQNLFFSVKGAAAMNGLWRSDGTEEGTVFLKGIEPGESDSLLLPHRFTRLGARLFLAAGDGEGVEPWVSDGTSSGTYQLANIAADERPAEPSRLLPVYDRLYFSPETPSDRFRLWRSDGTEPGTESLGLLGSEILATRAGVFFAGLSTEPYVIGGPYDEPRVIAPDLRGSTPQEFAFAEGQVFFAANGVPPDLEIQLVDGQYVLLGRELWVTRGTAESTRLVETESGAPVVDPTQITALDGKVLFRDFASAELWESDGTPAGTGPVVVADRVFVQRILTAIAGEMYFFGSASGTGTGLWVTDGTAEGTRALRDTRVNGPQPSVEGFGVLDRTLLFCIGDSRNRQLWRSDGTDAGTRQLTDAPGKGLFACSDFVGLGDRLLFLSEGALWRTDGTSGGTGIIHSALSSPGSLAVVGERAYFSACDELGCELWQTDGTPAGTGRAFDLLPGIASSVPGSLTAVGSTLFFVAYEDFTSRRLWAMRDLSSPTPCRGDCDGDRVVSVDEVIVLVNVALGESSLFACLSGDDGDGRLAVDEILGAINRVLSGCERGAIDSKRKVERG